VTRVCSCGAPISATNASGLCRPCVARRNASDPVIRQRQRDGINARMADPVYRAEHIARCVANGRNISDEVRERRRETGRLKAAALRAANAAIPPETRIENGRKRSDTVLAWCPPEWRPKYRDLKKRGRPAAEARRIVLDLIAGRPAPTLYAQQKAKLAWCPPSRRAEYDKLRAMFNAAEARRMIEADMTPFERKLARIASGARVVEKPVLRRADHDFTLGGVATGML
jgi:hypothetical protein